MVFRAGRDVVIAAIGGGVVTLIASYSGVHTLRTILWCGIAGGFALLTALQAAERRWQVHHPNDATRDRRRRIVGDLRRQWRAEYMTQHGDGIPDDVMMGTMNVPSDWINERLEQMGENWRV